MGRAEAVIGSNRELRCRVKLQRLMLIFVKAEALAALSEGVSLADEQHWA